MVRQGVHAHTLMAPRAPRSAGRVRRPAAFGFGPALAPLVAIGAALAGLLFLILLPICGVASIAQAVAAAGWDLAKRLVQRTPSSPPED